MRSIQEFVAWAAAQTDVDHGDPVSDDIVAAAETRVGPFPVDYRAFLQAFGWIEIGPWPFFGIGPHVPWHSELVRVTEEARAFAPSPLPPFFLPIQDNGGGDLLCFDTRLVAATGTSPVFYWDHAMCPPSTDHEWTADFLTFLSEHVDMLQKRMARARIDPAGSTG